MRLDGRVILQWNFNRQDGMAWTGLIWLRKGPATGPFESGNELFDFREVREMCWL